MPTAELIKPKSYNHLGRIWKQGEVVDITDELAADLEDNPRFRIRGFGAAREARVTSGSRRAAMSSMGRSAMPPTGSIPTMRRITW